MRALFFPRVFRVLHVFLISWTSRESSVAGFRTVKWFEEMDSVNKRVYHRSPPILMLAPWKPLPLNSLIHHLYPFDKLNSSSMFHIVPYEGQHTFWNWFHTRWASFVNFITGDLAERVNFCHWFQKFIAKRIGILDTTFFSDEAWFYLSGCVSTQDTRYWSFTNPNQELKLRYKAKRLESGVPFPEKKLLVIFFHKH